VRGGGGRRDALVHGDPSWVGDVPAELLACAYSGAGGQVPARGPSKSTIWRVLTGLDGEALDAAIGDWLMHQAYPASALRRVVWVHASASMIR
jgi:hypothetical protein